VLTSEGGGESVSADVLTGLSAVLVVLPESLVGADSVVVGVDSVVVAVDSVVVGAGVVLLSDEVSLLDGESSLVDDPASVVAVVDVTLDESMGSPDVSPAAEVGPVEVPALGELAPAVVVDPAGAPSAPELDPVEALVGAGGADPNSSAVLVSVGLAGSIFVVPRGRVITAESVGFLSRRTRTKVSTGRLAGWTTTT
jgi:hypothetical protein